MQRIVFLLSLVFLTSPLFADNQQLLEELDATLSQRAQFIHEKEKKINMLKEKLQMEKDSVAILKTLDKLYNEYYVFRFDSAMIIANKGLKIAQTVANHEYIDLFQIHLAEILAIGGLYPESIGILESISPSEIDSKYLFKYYFTFFIIYSYWSDYCHDQTFAPQYREMSNHYLKVAMRHADVNDPYYQYYKGEQRVYVNPDRTQARKYYHHILNTVPVNSRIHAMAAFALAGNYLNEGDVDKYEEFLIRAALSDVKCCTMETMAMQTLATLLFQKNEGNIERAERYICASMEDAEFYNNRLRIIEISRILPKIMASYQAKVQKQNDILRYSMLFISLLLIGLLLTILRIHRQNNMMKQGRQELADSNQQLSVANQQLADSNQQLSSVNQQLADSYEQQTRMNLQLNELNQKLFDTNKHRENLVSIYIDLCAKYIDKLGKYQTLVKRKIKANQAQELLQSFSSARISEEDAALFLKRFDKDFLELYPTFVEEFNALLTADAYIQLKSPTTLTTELRTFALIRLGVKNTADIAGLLFLSTQTIYNCRSTIKNKAINKDTFDDDVLQLCTVIQ